MNKRKSISKKIRFDIFKRDNFTCQYCGKMAPDIVLEIDHIIPVSKGGDNELLNLLTSCLDCNRGKSKTLISDKTILKSQQKELLNLSKKREQFKMLLDWKKELELLIEEQIDEIEKLMCYKTDWSFNDLGRKRLKDWINRFGFHLVYDSSQIALNTYYFFNGDKIGNNNDFNNAFNKIGGICYNKENNIRGRKR